ncbi:conserved hypothetical protein [Desulforapulum autotrophicum HRM2]|uniref:DUF5132 domain-containing protein n=1 Tax=Desulforapulum autotrophicum (strain ATCC 43914 / DSM 3382 / VKM B-1955 / HRM2) TaxID=177437 RepID=C0QCV9_DESAH|nr:DUF5132 domain-containing protein [Desulforapulum autotrophicum]ACN17191.1 conserved hypothetical protein [Desulforapulum autotrophicum HRM2]
MKYIPKGLTAGNVAIGVGVVLLAPIVLPILGSVAKPIIKSVIKGTLIAYDGVKVTIAEAKESLEDITAEAKAEVASKATVEE